MSDEPKWEMIESGWHCFRDGRFKTLGSAVVEEDLQWHCYIGDDTSEANFVTLKEAKQYIEGKTK